MPLPSFLQPSKSGKLLNNSILLRYILLIGCGWLTIIVINYFYTTITVFAVAGVLAALLNYPVVWLSRSMARGWAIAVTFLAAIVLLLGLVSLVGLQVLSQGQSLLGELGNLLNRQTVPQEFLSQIDLNSVIGTARSGLASGLGIVRTVFSNLFLALFIGERVAGLLGIFLSIPIAGMITLWMQPDPDQPVPYEAENLESN